MSKGVKVEKKGFWELGKRIWEKEFGKKNLGKRIWFLDMGTLFKQCYQQKRIKYLYKIYVTGNI